VISVDEWAVKAHETIHTSEVVAQDFTVFDEAGNPLGVRIQSSIRKGQVDARLTKDYDLKRAYWDFLEVGGIDAYMYFGKVLAGFTLAELVAFGVADQDPDTPDTEWKVRQSIERGRSEWGEALRRIGIRVSWR